MRVGGNVANLCLGQLVSTTATNRALSRRFLDSLLMLIRGRRRIVAPGHETPQAARRRSYRCCRDDRRQRKHAAARKWFGSKIPRPLCHASATYGALSRRQVIGTVTPMVPSPSYLVFRGRVISARQDELARSHFDELVADGDMPAPSYHREPMPVVGWFGAGWKLMRRSWRSISISHVASSRPSCRG